MTARRHDAGMTLLELTVASALALAAVAALTALFLVVLRARGRAGEAAETVVSLAGTIDQIARDVRLAGYDPSARGLAGIVTPTAQSVVLRADLDGSGDIDTSSEEQITYRLNAGGDTLPGAARRRAKCTMRRPPSSTRPSPVRGTASTSSRSSSRSARRRRTARCA